MRKEELERIINYNEHAIFLSEIAVNLLENNTNALIVPGIREIISMYLLIPYITKDLLDTPSSNHNIPQLNTSEVFYEYLNEDGTKHQINLEGLRNAICHSFVSLEDKGGIIVDDRSIHPNRRSHVNQQKKSLCERLDIELTRKKLLNFHKKVLEEQKTFNDKFKKAELACK